MVEYIGLDVHKKKTYGIVMNDYGKVLKKGSFTTNKEEVEDFLVGLKDPRVAMEASTAIYPLYYFLKSKGYSVIVSDPRKSKTYKRIKTDKRDAEMLATLLRAGVVPRAYVPAEETFRLRELTRHRVQLTEQSTVFKNQIHALLTREGVTIEEYSDIFGVKAMKELKNLELPETKRRILDNLLSLLERTREVLKEVDQELAERSYRSKEVRTLMSIGGMDYGGGIAIMAEVDNIRRFKSSEHFASWTGLVPSTYQSADKDFSGHITKQGNKYVRHILVQTVWSMVRSKQQNYLMDYYKHLTEDKGKNKNKAVAACARRLAKAIYAMLNTEKTFSQLDRELYCRKLRRLKIKTHKKEVGHIGIEAKSPGVECISA